MNKNYYIYGGIALVGVTLTILIIREKQGNGSLLAKEWIKPVDGRLTSPVGMRVDPVTKKQNVSHNGQDIAVPIGTKVKAPRDGEILNTNSSDAGGNQVVMVHNNGWFSGFAHLSKVLVSAGQKVKQGEIIALSGNTGRHTTGAHLHYTMKDEKGNTLDPRKYVYT